VEKIYVLGVGPGAKAYLPPVTGEKAAECDILVGGRRSLALFEDLEKETIEITGRLDPVIEAIRQKRDGKKIAVLVSGDTGIYSFLPKLGGVFGRDALEVYPGISAVQYFFARLGLCWHEASFISLHGRSLDDLARLAGNSERLVVSWWKRGLQIKEFTWEKTFLTRKKRSVPAARRISPAMKPQS